MMASESIQVVLGLLAVGGIGGVWFRLGSLTAKTENLAKRVDRVEHRIDALRAES